MFGPMMRCQCCIKSEVILPNEAMKLQRKSNARIPQRDELESGGQMGISDMKLKVPIRVPRYLYVIVTTAAFTSIPHPSGYSSRLSG